MSRGIPSKADLLKTVHDICSNNEAAQNQLANGSNNLLTKFANGYQKVCEEQGREFYGLRDFYSLVKMVFRQAVKTGQAPDELDQVRAVQRNFGGYYGDFKPVDVFLKAANVNDWENHLVPRMKLIREAFKSGIENRYLLLLTRNNIALRIIQESSLLPEDTYQIIFGSAFPQDQEYTQICSNIKQIQNAMLTGDTVILCNLDNLYESLYDVLNQSYMILSGERYTDIGLGTHRLKSKVHENFRMILLAEEDVVMNQFPTPLINRLEKHHLVMSTMLDFEQTYIVKKVTEWAKNFAALLHIPSALKQQPADIIIGYHQTIAKSGRNELKSKSKSS